MKIKEVSYGRLRSFGSYENERIDARADVSEGETADACLAQLQAWVGERMGDRDAHERIKTGMWTLQTLEEEATRRRGEVVRYGQIANKLKLALIELKATENPAAQALVAAFDALNSDMDGVPF